MKNQRSLTREWEGCGDRWFFYHLSFFISFYFSFPFDLWWMKKLARARRTMRDVRM